MAARLTRLLVALGLLFGGVLPSAAAAVVRPPTSQNSAASPVPDRGADPANARSYFGARYYRSDIGRFTTVDPELNVTQALADPQRWNRYAYALNNPLRYIDPDGRSSITFDAKEGKIYLYDKSGKLVGSWSAANNTQSSATIGRLVDGSYDFLDTSSPHTHGESKDKNGVLYDSLDGMFGSSGIFRLNKFTGADDLEHEGVGVHSGRANSSDLGGKTGVPFATNGCVRTTDEAMAKFVETAKTDPLTALTVKNNREKPKTPDEKRKEDQ